MRRIGARPRHFHQLPLHLVGIIRERVHLLARQHRAERVAATIGRAGLRILRHIDRLLEILDEQHDDVTVVALADAHFLEDAGKKPGEFRTRRVAARRQAADCREAVRRRLDRRRFCFLRDRLGPGDGDGCVRNHGVRLIDHRDEHACFAPFGTPLLTPTPSRRRPARTARRASRADDDFMDEPRIFSDRRAR